MTYPPPQPQGYQPPIMPGPAYQQPPPPWAPQPRKKKNHVLLWILGIVGGIVGLCMFIGVIGAIAGGDNDKTSDESAAGPDVSDATTTGAKKPAATKAPAKTAGIGDKVRDGKFEFVVTKLDCSKTKIGDQYLNTKAQGKFCIVSVTVTNISDEPQTFTGGDQKAYAGETEYSNDSEAELYLNDDNETFLEDVNPGNSVRGQLVFDVPKAVKLTSIELHDGWLSGGAKVSLG